VSTDNATAQADDDALAVLETLLGEFEDAPDILAGLRHAASVLRKDMDRGLPTPRRMEAVNTLIAAGYRWMDGAWVPPHDSPVRFRPPVSDDRIESVAAWLQDCAEHLDRGGVNIHSPARLMEMAGRLRGAVP
jgi:hypothetical protein